jgi:hypothetical protein
MASYHCDSVIVVIMFHKSDSIRNCAFCWNSSTFCWHNFFSVNIKRYTEVYQQKFVEKIRIGSHVLYQYTMCYMKCKAGELRAPSLQYSFENTIFTYGNQSELYAKVLLSIGKFLVRKCSIYNASYTFGACWKTGRCYALKVQRNMCIWIYKNVINKYFILLYKYCIVCYIICYIIFYYFI